jgi:acyl-coenzyme A thioesterase PaaI-like protein
MGVRVLALSEDWRQVRLLLPLNRRTRNPGGSMFGGCMASLADPIAALACSRVFPGYAVWTRAMSLDFRREGRGDLELRFDFDPALEQRIREELVQRGRATPSFEYAYYAGDGEACALVHNTVAIRSHHRHESGGALGRGKLPESPPAHPGRNGAQTIETEDKQA